MAYRIIEILTWENLKETGAIYASLNLMFYLVCCAGYSLLAVLSFVFLGLIVAVNIYSFLYKTSGEANEYDYVSRETIEDAFVAEFEVVNWVHNKLTTTQGCVQLLFGLILFSWINDLFGTTFLLWVAVQLVFILPSQYYSRKENVDGIIEFAAENLKEIKENIYGLIPKYKHGH